MKYCQKSGAEMNDDASFCPKCGAKVEEEKGPFISFFGAPKKVINEPDSGTGFKKDTLVRSLVQGSILLVIGFVFLGLVPRFGVVFTVPMGFFFVGASISLIYALVLFIKRKMGK